MEIVIYLIITLAGLYIISYFLRLLSPFFKRKPKTVENILHDYDQEESRKKASEWEKEWAKKKILKIYYSKKSKQIFQFISTAGSYSLSILDHKLLLLHEISLSIPKFYDGTRLTLKTLENSEDEIIVLICGLDYYQFDFSGEKIYEQKFVKKLDETILVYHSEDEFTVIEDDRGAWGDIVTFWIQDGTTFTNDLLLDHDLYADDDYRCYEYLQDVIQPNKGQFAFICYHANYGSQGIKIFDYDKSNHLKLIFDLHDLNFKGSFHSLAFNLARDKFATLLFQRDESGNDYFSILEYSVLDDKKPIRIIETKFGWQDFYELQTHFITDQLFCIVRNCDFIIYDLESETLKEVIKRDLRSAYHVDFNIVIYQKLDKIIIQEYN